MAAADVREEGHLPAPPRIPLVGGWQARGLRMLQDPTEYFLRQYRRFGGISAWDAKNPKHVFVFTPEYLRLLFAEPELFIVDAFREVRMPPDSSFLRLSNGLLRLNGEKHRSHRRLVQHGLHARRVPRYRDTMVELADRMLGTWRTGQTRRIEQDMARLVTRTAMRTILGVDAPAEADRLQGLIDRLLAVAASPLTLLFPYDLPGTTFRTALRVSEQIETGLRTLIADKRTDQAGNDVLTAMIAARDEDGTVLSDEELVAEAYTSFCHDSNISILTWTLFLLDRHPDAMDRLTAELRDTLGGAAPTAEDLDRLEYLDDVLKEVLRLLPAAPMLLRYTSREADLGPYRLPSGALLFYSPYVTHRLPELYEDPLRFDPDRWRDLKPTVYEYLPFGAGAHHCLGKHFALLEIKTVLAMLLQRFRPALVPGTRVDRAMRISFVPKQGMPMVLHPVGTRPAPAPVRGNITESVRLV
ncbi:cytochrome P450 [Streptomyces albidoflavus]|uniref:cytochrome P450 n=1 Tax=Streptomyces koyangensis TaxID=188770 RepID=UPI003CFF49BD|nr:cytochrome P450 [Streptomyces albidoflavus]